MVELIEIVQEAIINYDRISVLCEVNKLKQKGIHNGD
jgi:hypothetical protein